MKFRISICAASFAAAFTAAATLPGIAAAQQHRFITIGTGGVTGVYYPAGGAICRIVNRDRAKHGLRCSVESTGGSVANVNLLKSGELASAFSACRASTMVDSALVFGFVRWLCQNHQPAPPSASRSRTRPICFSRSMEIRYQSISAPVCLCLAIWNERREL